MPHQQKIIKKKIQNNISLKNIENVRFTTPIQ
jgi:hypothetical protein